MKEVQINSIRDVIEQIEESCLDDFLIHLAERLYMGIILDYKFQNDPNLEKFKEENNLNEPCFENVSRHHIFKDGFTYPNEDVIIGAFKAIQKIHNSSSGTTIFKNQVKKPIKEYIITDFNSMIDAVNFESIDDFCANVKDIYTGVNSMLAAKEYFYSNRYIFEYTPKPHKEHPNKIISSNDNTEFQFIRKAHRIELKFLMNVENLSEELKDQLKDSYVICDINGKIKQSKEGDFLFVPKENIQNHNYIILNDPKPNNQ